MFVPGITGQDGFYLAQKLTSQGHQVIGHSRNITSERSISFNHIFPDIPLLELDLSCYSKVESFFLKHNFDVLINLAGPSSVKESFMQPEDTLKLIVDPIRNFCEAASIYQGNRLHFVQASSSEVYAGSHNYFIDEMSAPLPLNPYGYAKLRATQLIDEFSKRGALDFTNMIMFNHESPIRGSNFVSQKIISGLVEVKFGNLHKIETGNLQLFRDWSYAEDFMDAFMNSIQKRLTGDFVLASGELHSIFEIAFIAHKYLSIPTELVNIFETSLDEIRVIEPNPIMGNSSKARKELDWSPSMNFESLIKFMVDARVRNFKSKN